MLDVLTKVPSTTKKDIWHGYFLMVYLDTMPPDVPLCLRLLKPCQLFINNFDQLLVGLFVIAFAGTQFLQLLVAFFHFGTEIHELFSEVTTVFHPLQSDGVSPALSALLEARLHFLSDHPGQMENVNKAWGQDYNGKQGRHHSKHILVTCLTNSDFAGAKNVFGSSRVISFEAQPGRIVSKHSF